MKLYAPEIKTLIELCRAEIGAATRNQQHAAEAGQWEEAKAAQARAEYIDSIRETLQSELTKQLNAISPRE